MKAQGELTDNVEAINKAIDASLPTPEREFSDTPLLFKINDVIRAFPRRDGEVIALVFKDDEWDVKYDGQLWNKLEEHFSNE